MGTLFASTLRALVREKSLFIWSLAFPILMATIFMFMFANLDGAMEFDPVPTGVVADEAWDTSPFSAVAEALGERGDDQLLDVCRFADGEAAASALVDGEVMGVFSVDEDGEPVLSLAPGLQIGQTTDMDAIDRSILESVVGTYVRDADLMTSIARENPGAFADPGRLEALFSSVDATEEVSLTHAAPKESVRFYYALFAMAALFGAQIAVVAVCWTQPNLSPLGARRALGAIGRTRTLLATLLACWLLSFCCLLIAFLYTRLVVGVDFAGREGLCVAGLGAASLLACALGTALGSLPKLDVGSKTGIPRAGLAEPGEGHLRHVLQPVLLRRAGGVRGERGAHRPVLGRAVRRRGPVREEAALCKPVDMPWKWWRSIPSICWCTWAF